MDVFANCSWPRWAIMWLIAGMMFGLLKILSWWSLRCLEIPLWKHVAYLLAWPGMDAAAFLNEGLEIQKPSISEWTFAAIKFIAGALLIGAITPFMGDENDVVLGWVAMIGLILLLHCGLFHILSCMWRSLGVDARPLMNSPLLATSVSDFWGHRWNTAFRDLTHRFLFRPLLKQLGPKGSLAAGFLVSGLIHEIAITIPAGAGYGGPTIFFMLQATGIFFERSSVGRRFGLGRGFMGWAFTAMVLIVPVRLLFPDAFPREIVAPFCRVIFNRAG